MGLGQEAGGERRHATVEVGPGPLAHASEHHRHPLQDVVGQEGLLGGEAPIEGEGVIALDGVEPHPAQVCEERQFECDVIVGFLVEPRSLEAECAVGHTHREGGLLEEQLLGAAMHRFAGHGPRHARADEQPLVIEFEFLKRRRRGQVGRQQEVAIGARVRGLELMPDGRLVASTDDGRLLFVG